jgi:hypothetical protein
MEKRASRRHRINTSIVCRCLNSARFGEPVDGRMRNCCINGLYAELGAHFKTGTVLVVRTTGSSCGCSKEEGFRSLAVAEVKWSRQRSIDGGVCYATGLRYLML